MTGSLQQKNGKYYAVINSLDNQGKRKQKWIATNLTVKGNKKRAEQFLRERIAEFELQENLIQSDVLFSDYVLHWLSIAKIKVGEITYQGYSDIAKTQVIPYFKERAIPLKKLTREDIQEYINEKSAHGNMKNGKSLSPKTIRAHYLVIQQTLKEAQKSKLILVSPCEFVVLPKMVRYEASFYTEAQIKDLFTAIKNEDIYPLIYFTAIYGLRRGEAVGLKWDSINFDMNTLTVKHTIVGHKEIIEKDTTKTKSSYRSYPLTPTVIELLKQRKEKEEENRKLFGKEYIENSYIFKWDNGKIYAPDYITSKFPKLLKKYGLPHIRFHDLRHSCASLLVAQGFELKDIQEWLGHSDIQTTANIYAHLDVKRKNNIANSMAKVMDF